MTRSTALLTDHYELTMVQAALHAGTADRRSVFELFPRRLPEGRRYGVVAGVGRALDAIEAFRFTDEDLAVLAEVVDETTCEWLASYRFSGDVWGYAEGEAYFPYSPLVVVEGTFAEAVVLETVLLSIYNHDSAIASAASRMTLGRRRPALHRDGLAPHPRGGGRGGRAGGVRRGLRHHLQPGRPAPVRRADRGDGRALLRPAARHRGRRVPRAGRLAGGGHDAARGHLRRRGGGPRRDRDRRHRARGGAPRLAATWGCSPTRCGPSSTPSAPPAPASW